MTTYPARQRGTQPFKPASAPFLPRGTRTDWAHMKPNDRVVVREAGKEPFEASVDIMTYDHTVIWLLPRSFGSRRAFHCNDEVDIVLMAESKTLNRRSRYSRV